MGGDKEEPPFQAASVHHMPVFIRQGQLPNAGSCADGSTGERWALHSASTQRALCERMPVVLATHGTAVCTGEEGHVVCSWTEGVACTPVPLVITPLSPATATLRWPTQDHHPTVPGGR